MSAVAPSPNTPLVPGPGQRESQSLAGFKYAKYINSHSSDKYARRECGPTLKRSERKERRPSDISRVGELEKRSFMYSRAPIPFSSDSTARLAPATVDLSCTEREREKSVTLERFHFISLSRIRDKHTQMNRNSCSSVCVEVSYYLSRYLAVQGCDIEDDASLGIRELVNMVLVLDVSCLYDTFSNVTLCWTAGRPLMASYLGCVCVCVCVCL